MRGKEPRALHMLSKHYVTHNGPWANNPTSLPSVPRHELGEGGFTQLLTPLRQSPTFNVPVCAKASASGFGPLYPQ